MSHIPFSPLAPSLPTLQPLPLWLMTHDTKPEQSKEVDGLEPPHTDGTFRPDQTITRAETIAMVNRILGRSASAGTVLRGYKTFQDVPADAWYYWELVEASTSHSFRMDGSMEKWTAVG